MLQSNAKRSEKRKPRETKKEQTNMKKATLPFPFNTKLKLSTLVSISAEVERELGRSPACSVRERWESLATVAGDCTTRSAAAAAIRASL